MVRWPMNTNAMNTAIMIFAAAVITRAVWVWPTSTDRALSRARPFLGHPADQEYLVVHGQAEQDRQHQPGHLAVDRAGRAEAEESGPPAPLEERGEHADIV
jgi:hypothetical protein